MDSDEVPWVERAACRGLDTELFLTKRGESTDEVKKICAACPVTAECLDYAFKVNLRHGVAGGLSDRERRKIRSERAAARKLAK